MTASVIFINSKSIVCSTSEFKIDYNEDVILSFINLPTSSSEEYYAEFGRDEEIYKVNIKNGKCLIPDELTLRNSQITLRVKVGDAITNKVKFVININKKDKDDRHPKPPKEQEPDCPCDDSKEVDKLTKRITELQAVIDDVKIKLGDKVDRKLGKGLSTEDFTTYEKEQLRLLIEHYIHGDIDIEEVKENILHDEIYLEQLTNTSAFDKFVTTYDIEIDIIDGNKDVD